ncbi:MULTISPECIES: MarR family winged helix-turn-helix transcriptional regulator [Methanobacterium]|uniref:HTH-type transcriptional regulator SarZ n=1 Tax=Methanobacterium veterum TaxID=408577 RepID=A0A9E5DJ92_9EURY|nr:MULTISPECIES: MarR family winged helix-turn-helix transcriptional regulator [Methanobacterium]MCZ3364978.1 MarR family winged helix-turn-helix transcriptional regulator [Methanobacterium veterum]MCZ3372733.1 MarR family winged helix-turn-helix transcriptional regulator [Methanobacterium veterum]
MKKGNITEILRYWEHINKLIRLKHRETAQKYELTFEQFHLMIELDHHAEFKLDTYELPPTVGEIAADIGNAPHTLSERIKRLEKKGMVKKIKDEEDLRINRVMLTDKGQNLIDRIKNESSNTFLYSALEEMDEKTLSNLSNGLKQLDENLLK